ncbi:MerR family transcriptional regulator [Gordonia amarae]|uniref:MerR family transcriptional regulator n=2 Tax=Gordonia amarae TaxID=36821 RepID=A0A857MDP5_9ACTN|nr:MerR family transcriptional regulator [Gordonia amarae]MCS3880102.1 DNA-binding transcriptional MerR regulator [Gordonia amarae]QHN18473.1 MerR family transcriptional regulator [Gordonia amarae]QHN22955.1 MerR family transcriptional regulator [Gordonia amarae]QHN31857.1 MerR family transcriptional regulator [Gordonia amarae]QHN40604.1 MerR family transcriptional regulator [Gordonia amarae]
MTDTLNLMSIGEFSSITRISVRMLRYYDTHGVLSPVDVDGATGYRRYSSDQITVAGHIRRLRDVGFGVSAIGALLAVRDTPDYARALRAQRTVLVDEAEAAAARLGALERMLTESEKEYPMSQTPVALTTLEPTTIAYLRDTIPNYQSEGMLWERFMPALAAQGVQPLPGGGCIEHDAEFRESDVTESVFVPVAAGTTVSAPLATTDLPERRAVIATATGPYHESIPRAHEAISRFMADHGLSAVRSADIATHHFNVYVTDPSQVPADELVVEVVMPVGQNET